MRSRKAASGPKRGKARGARHVDLLGWRIDAKAIAGDPTYLSVFDGQLCCGHLILRGKQGVEAYDADDVSLGIYPTQLAAANAVFEQWKRS